MCHPCRGGHSPVTVPLPEPVCEELLLTLAVLLAVSSALRVRVTDAVMLWLAVNEADGDTVPVPLLVLVPVPLPLVDGVGVEVMLVLGLEVGVALPVAESELVGDSVALTEAEPLAVIEADEVTVAEAATKQVAEEGGGRIKEVARLPTHTRSPPEHPAAENARRQRA